jgi:hypothetical protein
LSVEVSLVVEMAKIGIIKPSLCTPHARLGTKRPGCSMQLLFMDALDKIADDDETFLPDLMYCS